MEKQGVIKLEGVSKGYGNNLILNEFNLNINKGEFLTIIGSSGCGKTTVLKLINGLLTPDSGKVHVNGEDISVVNQIQLRRKIGYVIQGVGLFPHMNRQTAAIPSTTGTQTYHRENRLLLTCVPAELDLPAFA